MAPLNFISQRHAHPISSALREIRARTHAGSLSAGPPDFRTDTALTDWDERGRRGKGTEDEEGGLKPMIRDTQ